MPKVGTRHQIQPGSVVSGGMVALALCVYMLKIVRTVQRGAVAKEWCLRAVAGTVSSGQPDDCTRGSGTGGVLGQ